MFGGKVETIEIASPFAVSTLLVMAKTGNGQVSVLKIHSINSEQGCETSIPCTFETCDRCQFFKTLDTGETR